MTTKVFETRSPSCEFSAMSEKALSQRLGLGASGKSVACSVLAMPVMCKFCPMRSTSLDVADPITVYCTIGRRAHASNHTLQWGIDMGITLGCDGGEDGRHASRTLSRAHGKTFRGGRRCLCRYCGG